MAEEQEDLEWLSDYVLHILKAPTWVSPIAQFVDERCIVFEPVEENKLEYTTCHMEFKQLIDSLLAAHLLEISISPEQFQQFCLNGLAGNPMLHRVLVEQLLSVDDFLTFKAMMTRRNTDLFREALVAMERGDELDSCSPADPEAVYDIDVSPAEQLEQLGEEATAGTIQEATDAAASIEEWQMYEDQLFQALQESEADLRFAAERASEEEELEKAIEMSLQAEAERMRQAEEEEERQRREEAAAACQAAMSAAADAVAASAAPAPPAAPPAAAPTPAPVRTAPSSLPPLRTGQLPKMLPLHPLSPSSGLTKAAPSPFPQHIAASAVEHAQAIASMQRERLPVEDESASRMAAKVAHQVAEPAAPQMPSEAEIRARAEHLKRQREFLVEKRNKERQRQLGEFQKAQQAGGARRGVDAASSAAGQQRVAELTGGPDAGAPTSPAKSAETAASAAAMRQALTVQLRQTLTGAAGN